MSRLAGLISFSGPPVAERLRLTRLMLGRLPGDGDRLAAPPESGAGLGWRGWSGRGGGLAEAGADVLVLDGRLFNGEELRPLAGTGAGESDAALLLALFRRLGPVAALERVNGDFAVAYLDGERRGLWLGRDRLGLKPLYFARAAGGFAFASQPRALLALPGVPATVNRRYVALVAASHYRTFDTAPDESPYAAIGQVPAATLLEIRDDGAPRRHLYWSLADAPDLDRPEEDLAGQYRALLTDAVARRLNGAGRAGFTLSGGMDSSSVLCCAVEAGGRRQHAFSSVYEDRTYDERDDIRDLLADKVEQWHPIEIGNDIDIFALIERLVAIHDEPVATATWLSHALVCDAVSAAGFETLFGGLGGDELNAGEYEYFPFFFADLRAAGDRERLEREIACWAAHHDHPIHRKNAAVAAAMLERRVDAASPGQCRPDRERLARYHAALNPGWFDIGRAEPELGRPFSGYLKSRAWQDMSLETLPCCLRAEDRQCTAAGLNHHDPFLDHRLVEFMFRVPVTLKIRDGVTKVLLRRAMTGVLPEATRGRIKKTGWNAPAHRWFGGAMLDRLRDIVASRDFVEAGVYDVAEVRRLIDDHARIVATEGSLEENHMMFLWQLANLHTWMTRAEA